MTHPAFPRTAQGEPEDPRYEVAPGPLGRDGSGEVGPHEAECDAVSAREISDLVSGALEDAIQAAAEPCPATYLILLERRKRDRIISGMNGLPAVQLVHPVVQAEVFTEVAMLRARRKLANAIVEGIRNYAQSKRRAQIAAIT